MDSYDKITASMLYGGYRNAADNYNADPTSESAERRLDEAWVEWRDFAEDNGLCQDCGKAGATERVLCAKCETVKGE